MLTPEQLNKAAEIIKGAMSAVRTSSVHLDRVEIDFHQHVLKLFFRRGLLASCRAFALDIELGYPNFDPYSFGVTEAQGAIAFLLAHSD